MRDLSSHRLKIDFLKERLRASFSVCLSFLTHMAALHNCPDGVFPFPVVNQCILQYTQKSFNELLQATQFAWLLVFLFIVSSCSELIYCHGQHMLWNVAQMN